MTARIRPMAWLARHAPALGTFQVAAMRRELVSPPRRERSLRRELAAAPGVPSRRRDRAEDGPVAP